MIKNIKFDLNSWWQGWKDTHYCRLSECSLETLERRRVYHKHMSMTYVVHFIIVLSLIVDMYLESQGDIVINMICVLVMLALYDTRNELNYVEQFIYLKRREENGICRK